MLYTVTIAKRLHYVSFYRNCQMTKGKTGARHYELNTCKSQVNDSTEFILRSQERNFDDCFH